MLKSTLIIALIRQSMRVIISSMKTVKCVAIQAFKAYVNTSYLLYTYFDPPSTGEFFLPMGNFPRHTTVVGESDARLFKSHRLLN
jgi:hypothetical protein